MSGITRYIDIDIANDSENKEQDLVQDNITVISNRDTFKNPMIKIENVKNRACKQSININ